MNAEWTVAPFRALLLEPVRNGIYKPKVFHGRGAKIVNMGELFAYPRLGSIEMRRIDVSKAELARVSLKRDDLLFARRSIVAEGAGKCCLITEVDEPTVFESSIIRARPDPTKADSAFLFYLFSSATGRHLLQTIRRQVAVAGITGRDLEALELSVPSLEEQRRIARILGALDEKIEHNRLLSARLGEVLSFDFRERFAPVLAVSVSESAGWESGRLGDEVKVIMGQSPPGSSYSDDRETGPPLIQGNADLGFRFPEPSRYTSAPTKRSQPGDVLFTVRAPVGTVNIADREYCLGRGVAALRSDLTVYAEQLVRALARRWAAEESGTIFPSVNRSQIAGLEINRPPRQLAERFDRQHRPTYELIGLLDRETTTLAGIRNALLPKLVSGQIRVPDAYDPDDVIGSVARQAEAVV